MVGGVSGWRGGEGEEAGWSRVVGELCRAYAVTLGTGRGDAGRRLPLPLLRDLAQVSPCLAAPGGSGQSLLSPGKSVLGSVCGGCRQEGVGEGPGQSREPRRNIPLFWRIPAHPMSPWGRGCMRPRLLLLSCQLPHGAGVRLQVLGFLPFPAQAILLEVAPRTAALAALRVLAALHHAGEPPSRRAVAEAALPALSANLWQHRCALCSAWSSSATSVPPHPAAMVRGWVRHPRTAGEGTPQPWQWGPEGCALLSSIRGPALPAVAWQGATRSSHGTPRQVAQPCERSRQQDAGSTSARVTINLLSINPSVRSRITPVTTQLARRLHLHRVSAVDLQISATMEGPCL